MALVLHQARASRAFRKPRRARRVSALALACAAVFHLPLNAAQGDWYFGVGGGGAWLLPDAVQSGIGVEERVTPSAELRFGRQFDDRTRLELGFGSLGQARFENDSVVNYYSADASALYSFFNGSRGLTRDLQLFGRLAVGYRERDTDVELFNDSPMYFGVGLGAELALSQALSLRMEGLYEGEEVMRSQLSMVVHFGGGRAGQSNDLPPLPPLPVSAEVQNPDREFNSSRNRVAQSATATPAAQPLRMASAPAAVPSTPLAPLGGFGSIAPDGSIIYRADAAVDRTVGPRQVEPVQALVDAASVVTGRGMSVQDRDQDGVADGRDRCTDSAPGFPVRADGCALLDGVLSGVRFEARSEHLRPEAYSALSELAGLLKRYPTVRIELHSHSDAEGDVRSQSILTRARLREVGTYLMQQGISANRLVLRSFGGTRPLYDNADALKSPLNNRIEVLEHRG